MHITADHLKSAGLLALVLTVIVVCFLVWRHTEIERWKDYHVPHKMHCDYCGRDYVRMMIAVVIANLPDHDRVPSYFYYEMKEGKLVECPEARLCYQEHRLLAEAQKKL